MAGELRDLGSGATVYYGNLAGIWVMVLHSPPTEADMLLARPSLAKMAKAEPLGFPTLTCVLSSAGFSLDAPSKEAASKVTAEFSASILCRATVIEGSGFQGAAVRAIVTGIDFLSRSKGPGKVFGELEPSIAWCQAHSPKKGAPAPSLAELAQALGDTVARLRPTSA